MTITAKGHKEKCLQVLINISYFSEEKKKLFTEHSQIKSPYPLVKFFPCWLMTNGDTSMMRVKVQGA